MKKSEVLYSFFFLTIFTTRVYSQTTQKIKFQKDALSIYFFQKGEKRDTLSKKDENLFYLVVSDSLKKDLIVEVENGQLVATQNDSLFKWNYVPGFKYESFYAKRQEPADLVLKGKGAEFQTFVNGTSLLSVKQTRVMLRYRITGEIILENNFFCE